VKSDTPTTKSDYQNSACQLRHIVSEICHHVFTIKTVYIVVEKTILNQWFAAFFDKISKVISYCLKQGKLSFIFGSDAMQGHQHAQWVQTAIAA
jgi:hypothetical protein